GAAARLLEEDDVVFVSLEDGARAVGRAVVDDDELERTVALREDAFDGTPDERFAVVDGKDDGDESHRGYFNGFAPVPVPRSAHKAAASARRAWRGRGRSARDGGSRARS